MSHPFSRLLGRYCGSLLLVAALSACVGNDHEDAAADPHQVLAAQRQSDGAVVAASGFNVGDYVVLQAPAGGDAGASYQWYRNGVAIEGATGASYELGQASSLDDSAEFSVRVSSTANPAGTLSQPLLLSVQAGEGVDLLAGFLGGEGHADGVGSAARLHAPASLARDAAGNLYVAESETQVIRKISSDGVVSTLAGRLAPGGGMLDEVTDGVGAAARFRFLREITMGRDGNLYAIDGNTIRRITLAGEVKTLAGSSREYGSTPVDGDGAAARLANPREITVDVAGNVLIRDGMLIRKITPAGVVSTVVRLADDPPPMTVGIASARSRFKQQADGVGAGWPTGEEPKWQAGLVADAGGNLYAAVPSIDRLLKIAPNGTISEETQLNQRLATLLAAADFWLRNAVNDGDGNLYLLLTLPQSKAQSIVKLAADGGLSRIYSHLPVEGNYFDEISDIVAHAGQVYAAFYARHTIQRIDARGNASLVAGSSVSFVGTRDGLGRAARFSSPTALVADSQGNSYVAGFDHVIRKITPNGMVSTLAGKAGEAGHQDGSGGSARFNQLSALVLGKDGNLYVADTGNKAVRMVTPAGVVTTLANIGASFERPHGLAFDSNGTLYVEDFQHIVAISPDGSVRSYPFSVLFRWHSSLTSDASGNLYAALNFSIVKLSTDGTMTTLAGEMNQRGNVDGVGSAARFQRIGGMTTDAAGNLYVADTFNQTIRKVTPAGAVTTVVGQAGVRGVQLGTAGRLNQPVSVAVGTRHGRPALFILNRTHRGDWQQSAAYPSMGMTLYLTEPYGQSDVNVVTVPLP